MNCNIHCHSPYITGSKNSSVQAINQPTRNIAIYSCQKKHTEKKRFGVPCYGARQPTSTALASKAETKCQLLKVFERNI